MSKSSQKRSHLGSPKIIKDLQGSPWIFKDLPEFSRTSKDLWEKPWTSIILLVYLKIVFGLKISWYVLFLVPQNQLPKHLEVMKWKENQFKIHWQKLLLTLIAYLNHKKGNWKAYAEKNVGHWHFDVPISWLYQATNTLLGIGW